MQSNNIKICHVASVDITVQFLLMPQLTFLMSQGYEVSVVCAPGTLIPDIVKEGINVKTITIKRRLFSPFSDIVALWQLFWFFKKESFDIVHVHGPKPGLLGQLAAKWAGVPIIINTIHGLYFTENSSFTKKAFFVFIEKIAAQCSTLIFSQNKEDIETIMRLKIARPEKIIYLGNGINMNRFNPAKISQDAILQTKKELGIDPNSKIIGMVGRLVKEKGYLEAFEAMKEVVKKYPTTLLLIIGPKEPQKKDGFTTTIVSRYGIQDNTRFLGERKDVELLYPLMDIFLFASHREGMPRSVIEAMAMQKAIIVTNIRGCREEIEDGIHGLMIPAKDPQKMAKALIFLLKEPQKAALMAKQARERALAEFDEKMVIARIQSHYSELLKEKSIT